MTLYGAKCHICYHILHTGAQKSEEIPWLTMKSLECAGCSFCQEAALMRSVATLGLGYFDPEVRRALHAFQRGANDPLLDRLRIECLAIGSTVQVAGTSWRVADAQFDDGENGAHLHLTLTPTRAAEPAKEAS